MIAVGMGANVIVADRNAEALRRVAARFGNAVRTIFSTPTAIAELVKRAGLLTGAVLLPGAATPKVVSRGMLPNMKPGAVIVDVAIDQGGCCETSRPTMHPDPTYLVDGIVHYCVSNMSEEVPPTSTFALDNAIPPFVLAIAQKGWRNALRDDIHLRAGLNVSGRKSHMRRSPGLMDSISPRSKTRSAFEAFWSSAVARPAIQLTSVHSHGLVWRGFIRSIEGGGPCDSSPRPFCRRRNDSAALHLRRRRRLAPLAMERRAPKKPMRPYTYSEGENESPQIVQEEPVEVERDVPDTENTPVEGDERQDKPDPPLFEE